MKNNYRVVKKSIFDMEDRYYPQYETLIKFSKLKFSWWRNIRTHHLERNSVKTILNIFCYLLFIPLLFFILPLSWLWILLFYAVYIVVVGVWLFIWYENDEFESKYKSNKNRAIRVINDMEEFKINKKKTRIIEVVTLIKGGRIIEGQQLERIKKFKTLI